MIVSGLPPIGCLPIQMTARFELPKARKCLDDQNSDAKSYNQKLKKLLPHTQASFTGTRILYADIYTPFMDLVTNSEDNGKRNVHYMKIKQIYVSTTFMLRFFITLTGFKVIDRGCCGTGYIETGSLCNVLTPTCKNASEFMFWDSAHPTEAVYQYVHDYLVEELGPQLIDGPKVSVSE